MTDPLTSFCVGCGFLLGGVILDIISIATREWTTFHDGSTSGLWVVCTPVGFCVPIHNTAKMDGVRAMMVLSVLVSGIALIINAAHIAHICRKKILNKWVVILAAFLAIFAVVLALIGILVYHRHIWDETHEQVVTIRHGYSFWLGVAAIILFFLAGFFFVISAILLYRSLRKLNRPNADSDLPDSKSKTPIKEVQWSNNLYGDFETYPPRGYRLYPFNDDFVPYGTTHLPPGVYSYEDPRILNPWSRDKQHSSDYRIPRAVPSRPPFVWVA